jgi:hypothetical protein
MDRVYKALGETLKALNPDSNGFDKYLDRGMIKLLDGSPALAVANYVFVELSPYLKQYSVLEKKNADLLEALKREHYHNLSESHRLSECPVCQLIRRCER